MTINEISQINITPIIAKPSTQNNIIPIEQPSENKNHQKELIAVGTGLALVTLGVLGYKGKLGEGVQKFLGGAKKAVTEETGTKTEEKAKKTFKELYENAIKEKKATLEDTVRNRIHNFEYDSSGKLIRETVKKGDDYAIYENINGKMRIIEAKKGDTVSKRLFNENGKVEIHCKPENPVIAMPKLKHELPPSLKPDELPKDLEPSIMEAIEKNGKFIDANGIEYEKRAISYYAYTRKNRTIIESKTYDKNGKVIIYMRYSNNADGRTIMAKVYNPSGKATGLYNYSYDAEKKVTLIESYNSEGRLDYFEAKAKDGNAYRFDANGKKLSDAVLMF